MTERSRLHTSQTIQLYQYLSERADSGQLDRVPFHQIARQATQELGFEVTRHHVARIRDGMPEAKRWRVASTGSRGRQRQEHPSRVVARALLEADESLDNGLLYPETRSRLVDLLPGSNRGGGDLVDQAQHHKED